MQQCTASKRRVVLPYRLTCRAVAIISQQLAQAEPAPTTIKLWDREEWRQSNQDSCLVAMGLKNKKVENIRQNVSTSSYKTVEFHDGLKKTINESKRNQTTIHHEKPQSQNIRDLTKWRPRSRDHILSIADVDVVVCLLHCCFLSLLSIINLINTTGLVPVLVS